MPALAAPIVTSYFVCQSPNFKFAKFYTEPFQTISPNLMAYGFTYVLWPYIFVICICRQNIATADVVMPATLVTASCVQTQTHEVECELEIYLAAFPGAR